MRAPAVFVLMLVCAGATALSVDGARAAECRSGPYKQSRVKADLHDHNFRSDPPGTWQYTNFEEADLRGAIFIGVDLTGSSFKKAQLGPSTTGKGPASFNRATLTNTCFIGATLDATDFNYAEFRCADFANTSLINADFGPEQKFLTGSPPCRTSFAGATLDVNAIALENWGKIDLSNAKFLGVSPAAFNARGADLTGAMLAGVELPAIDFTGANLTNVDLSGAKLARAKFDQASLNGAKLSKMADLNFASFKCARFFGKATDDTAKICPAQPLSSAPNAAADLTQGEFQNADFTNATLNSAILRGATLAGATMRGTSFINATLEPGDNIPAASVLGADFTKADFTGARLNYVRFQELILTGAKFDNTTLSSTDFSRSIMPSASFVSSVLQNVGFKSAILQAANFTLARLEKSPGSGGSGVDFTCAQLGGADFSNAKVYAADFQSAVMPPESSCCVMERGPRWCGTIGLTGQAYGPVVFPVPEAAIMCPNGQIAKCTETQWTIPNWQTRFCNQSQTTETVWTKPNCGGTPGEIVTFNDAKLKQCITESLPTKPSEVATATAKRILQVSCPARGIKDLTGLEQFTALTSLDLSGNEIKQYALKLPKLQTLKIAGNGLTSLDLDESDDLFYLDASNNKLSSINGDVDISFTLLDLSHNEFTEFSLPIHETLLYADLSHNRLTKVLGSRTSLGALTRIQYLDLSKNSLSTIGSVANIAKKGDSSDNALRSLFLACNSQFACNSLAITGEYPALVKSSCAAYNEQTRQWIIRTNPDCPLSKSLRRK